MATQSKRSNGSTAKAGATKAKSGAKQAKSGAKQVAKAEKNQAQVVAEAALDLPVGAVLSVTDRVGELVEPFTDRNSAERKIKAYRTELRRTLKRTERRGASARRKATTEAKKTRNRVEREARKRQRAVETTLKRNRNDVEQRFRKTIEGRTSRAQDLVEQLGDQLPSLR
jgi:Holliday junction resolvasome RuvABC ATP-dependent DNA helicase subunit